jgi:hypothetical protein
MVSHPERESGRLPSICPLQIVQARTFSYFLASFLGPYQILRWVPPYELHNLGELYDGLLRLPRSGIFGSILGTV